MTSRPDNHREGRSGSRSAFFARGTVLARACRTCDRRQPAENETSIRNCRLRPMGYALRSQANRRGPRMAEVLWYYAKNDQQHGPVTPAELRQLATAHALLPEDLIWREGMDGWAPASKVKGLFADVREPVAARPTISNGPTETMPPAALAAILAPPAEPAPAATAGSGIPADVFATPPAGTVPDSRPAPRALENQSGEQPSVSQVVDLLWLCQVILWAICIAIVFFGGLLFTRAFVTAETAADEAAAAAVFSTFFIAAYVVARAGERVAALLQAYFERRRR